MIIMIITLFQDGKIAAANARVRAFLEFHLLEHSARYAFQATGCTIIKTMFSGQREMNPVTMTITNLRKKKSQGEGSTKRRPVLKSCALPTEECRGVTSRIVLTKQIISWVGE